MSERRETQSWRRQRTLVIQTPEGIVFPLVIADPVTRFLALVVDLFCIQVVMMAVLIPLRIMAFIGGDIAAALWLVVSFSVSTGYPMLLEWRWQGRTIGKRLLRIQVMDRQGLRLQIGQVVIRNLLRAVDGLPLFYMVGGISAAMSATGQRLGDMAANTIVIRHPRIDEPDLEKILPSKYNSFRDHPHLAARIRRYTTPAEAGTALQAVLRRDDLEPSARLVLFERLKTRFAGKAVFPQEIVEGLSDEQYTRNAVDILFRSEA